MTASPDQARAPVNADAPCRDGTAGPAQIHGCLEGARAAAASGRGHQGGVHQRLAHHQPLRSRLAADTLMVWALGEQGTRVIDGKAIMEHARRSSSAEEIAAVPWSSLSTCVGERSIAVRIRRPETARESEAFGHLVGESLALKRRIPGNPVARPPPAYQPVVPGGLRPGHAGGRASLVRYRPDRADGLL